MSVGEIQKSIAALSPGDLRAVEALLQRLRKRDDPARALELGGIMRDMDAGKKLSLEQVSASLAAHPAAE
jgi:hypothetical protein